MDGVKEIAENDDAKGENDDDADVGHRESDKGSLRVRKVQFLDALASLDFKLSVIN